MKIVWNSAAEDEWAEIIDYCGYNYGQAEAEKKNKRLAKVLQYLESYPEIGHINEDLVGKKYEYREFIVMKPIKVVYFIEGEDIVIAAFVDMRRDPKKLKKQLK